MFKIVRKPTFQHVVNVNVPVDGGFEEQTLKVTYNVLPAKELIEIEPGFDLDRKRQYLERIVNSFDDLVGEDGKPVACDANLRNKLLDLFYVQPPVMEGYVAAMTGAKTKN